MSGHNYKSSKPKGKKMSKSEQKSGKCKHCGTMHGTGCDKKADCNKKDCSK
jgi:hypothetical protein